MTARKRILYAILGSIGICLGFAILGNLLTGDALETWYLTLDQPWFSLPLWSWYIVGILYYLICASILYRLFIIPSSTKRNASLFLILVMLAGNEVWNYLFFGLESTFLAFISLIPFSILVFLLFIKLKKIDKKSALILTPYLIWLIYDLSWTYYLWKLN